METFVTKIRSALTNPDASRGMGPNIVVDRRALMDLYQHFLRVDERSRVLSEKLEISNLIPSEFRFQLTDQEIKRLHESPEALKIVIDIHDYWICEGEAMDFNCAGNKKRIEEIRKEIAKLEAEL